MNPTESDRPGAVAPPQSGPTGPSGALEDRRVVGAMEEYQAALEAGREPDPQEFLDRHPDLAPVLAECLEGIAFVHQIGPRLDQPEALAGAKLSETEDLRPEGP